MKTKLTIAIIALCALAFAAQESKPPSDVNLLTRSIAAINEAQAAKDKQAIATIGPASPSFTTGLVIRFPDDILLVTGLRREDEFSIPPRVLTHAEYRHPETPDEITVTITTADHRKWRAKWEEIK